ncbi:1,4-alpha-glucan branching protein domain-containing protein [Litchfieldia alkalitelluris]|uniref:1,4-alpha-glucan branching protein domain-containing protein n=1 Tax=Litchfieldia alkalitelluris TaxID=304268 RepID=UPI0009971CDA|nr:1,4-alpha-glucan branching protein domain-containing protein [Litchfieldia alkalitelluris]
MYTNIVLHAHLPYVRSLNGDALEERWLYEAMAESYIPLIWKLEEDNHKRKWTLSLSPTLMEMLADPLLQQRFLEYIQNLLSLLQAELSQNTNQEELSVILFYLERTESVRETFLKFNRNLLFAFNQFEQQGKIECITTSASHAFLPYLSTEQGIRSQIREGIQTFKKYFGKLPAGFWLPECAYSDDVDQVLAAEGIQYTFVDEHALLNAKPTPKRETGAPVHSPHGVTLFPRNQKLSNKVWCATTGYPGDIDYREFYRDVGHDRDYAYIKPFLPQGIRVDTGLKYYKITGAETKEFYRRDFAEAKICQHAEDFLKMLEQERELKGNQSYPPYMVVLPFDAELFGHWWFEGPDWLHQIMSSHQGNIEFLTGSEFVRRHRQDLEICEVSFSSWGRNGYGDVWLNEKNEWIYRHLHRMESEIIRAVDLFKNGTLIEHDAIKQMIREWFLFSSSDWAFMLDNGHCDQYALRRIEQHLTNFIELQHHLYDRELTEESLRIYRNEYPFLSTINLSSFSSMVENEMIIKPPPKNGLRILMLSWEFPPLVVGGLSRHVYDLSRALVEIGHQVTVVTSAVEGSPYYEVVEGVEVYRVDCLQPHATEFLDWIGSLNMSFTKTSIELEQELSFDIMHAHDWLVAVSAIMLKSILNKPLVSTIHATEYGRNNGIYTELQRKIHAKEEELTKASDAVIVCSEYMEEEVIRLFHLHSSKVHVFPNGVDPSMLVVKNANMVLSSLLKLDYSHLIFSVGRIVQEKGFETVIDAASIILEEFPHVLILIAGKGPMLKDYRKKVKTLGLENNIVFIGFISDEERNMYFKECDITLFPSIYEPFGIVALEGMAAGKPTIVSDTGGLKDIVIHGKTGLKMIPGDKESLAREVLHLLRDEVYAAELGRNGKLAVTTTYAWEKIAQDTSQVFMDMLQQPISIRG